MKCLIFLSSQKNRSWIQQFSGVEDILFPSQLTDFNVWRNGDVCISNSVKNQDEWVSLEKWKKLFMKLRVVYKLQHDLYLQNKTISLGFKCATYVYNLEQVKVLKLISSDANS